MEIPLIKKFEAGYARGRARGAPEDQVLVKYAGTTGAAFKDPTKGKELALAEYHDGADIIFHASGSTGLGVFEAAREKDKLAIGVDSDQYDEAPGHVLTSMVKRVDIAVFDTIQQVTQGRHVAGRRPRRSGSSEQGVGWVYDDRNQALIPAPVKASRRLAASAEIVAGRDPRAAEPCRERLDRARPAACACASARLLDELAACCSTGDHAWWWTRACCRRARRPRAAAASRRAPRARDAGVHATPTGTTCSGGRGVPAPRRLAHDGFAGELRARARARLRGAAEGLAATGEQLARSFSRRSRRPPVTWHRAIEPRAVASW